MNNQHSVSNTVWLDKTAIVVGASAGLGRILTDALAARGCRHICLAARDAPRLETVHSQLMTQWPAVQFSQCACDASTRAGTDILAKHVSTLEHAVSGREPGKIDLLINAIGLSDRGPALKLTTERLDELMRANVYAPLLTVQQLVPYMAARGVIVNVGSLSSYFAPRYLGGYSIAKHGLRALTQQLRLELKDTGLHVMLVCPGPIARDGNDTSRYANLSTAVDVPREALAGGGGAKIRGLDPKVLAAEILQAAARRKVQLIRPRKAKLLLWLMAVWPSRGEAWLRRMTS